MVPRASRASTPSLRKARSAPDENVSWEALQPRDRGQTTRRCSWPTTCSRCCGATAVAKEGAVTATVVGGGDEYKRVEDIAADRRVAHRAGQLSPEAPDVSDAATALEASTEELRYWHDAPANAAILAKRGVPFALTAQRPQAIRSSSAQAWPPRSSVGLKAADALAAVTTTPAKTARPLGPASAPSRPARSPTSP